MIKSAANSPSEAPSVVTPGQLFKSKREEKGLEKKDIVAALRLSLYQIEALENDEYDKLPEATYVIGYWRSYAKLLKIDASQSIEYYRDHIAPSSTIALEAHHRLLYGQHEKHRTKIALFLGLFSVLLLFGIGYWQTLEDNVIDKWIGKESDRQSSVIGVNNDNDKALSIDKEVISETTLKLDQYITIAGPEIDIPEHVDAGQSAVSENLEEPLNNEADAVVENEIEPDDVIVTPQQAVGENQPEVSQTSSQTSSQTIENSSEPEEEDYQKSKILLANPSNSIFLKVEKKTWLDVRDVTGEKLIYRTARAGEEIQLNGHPPFYIFVEVVGGVLVEYLGETVEMDAPDDSDFQRIRVGRQE